MSSPITVSGFNNIDFSSVLTALMAQASQPLTALQAQQSALTAQATTYDSLNAQLATLNDAANALGQSGSTSAFKATASDASAVAVSTSSGAVAGHYDVVVQELARAQVTASTGGTPDATSTIVATGGSLTIGGVAVTLAGSSTLQQVADSINATSGVPATATVVQSGAGNYRLVLTGKTSGSSGAFTVANGLTGGTGVGFTDTDSNGLSGDSAADNAVSATDASVLINNVLVVSSSNTLSGAIPGVSLTVFKKDPATTVSVDVAPDQTALANQVTTFINAYNDLVKFANAQSTSAANGDSSSIGRDSLLRGLRNQLRSSLSSAYSGGVFSHLSEVGVEFTQTGTLQLNQTVFQNAITNHADDVTQLFSGTGGAFQAIGDTISQYSQGNGLVSIAKTSLTTQANALNNQISAMQARLAIQKTSLQAEFAAADAAMSALNSQSSAITNFSNSLSSGGI